MTLLQIIQAVANELGLTPVTFVIGNTDQMVRQYLALANQVGTELATGYEWQKMNKVHTFTVQTSTQNGVITDGSKLVTGLSSTAGMAADTWQVTGDGIPQDTYLSLILSANAVVMSQFATQSGTVSLTFTQTIYDMPEDFDFQVNRTHWDRTNHWELVGPKSAQEWQWLKSGIIATGPRIRYRLLGGKFQIWPLGISDSQIAYEYIGTSWVYSGGETQPDKALFSTDDDTCVFRDRLMINGIKLRFFQVKGFESSAFQAQYDSELGKAQSQDAGAPTLSMSPQRSPYLISPWQIQDGNFPG